MISGFVINAIRDVPVRIWNFILNHITTTIEVPDHDVTFDYIKNYLGKHSFIGGLRFINVYCKNENFIYSPAPGTHWFFYKGRLAQIYRHRKELENSSGKALYENFSIKMFTRKFSILEEYLQDAKSNYVKNDSFMEVKVSDGWGNWSESMQFCKRPLESVILPGETANEVHNYVENYFNDENRYKQLGIPYRLGILCEGIPGGGKTSLIKALAGHFNKKLYILPLSDKNLSDSNLLGLISCIEKGSFIIIEDIDCIFKSRESKSNDDVSTAPKGVTLSGLLNAIDGVASPEGNVLFMTTNYPELLDEALIRPGRIDKRLHFDYATKEQMERIYKRFYTDTSNDEVENFINSFDNEVSMAQVQQKLLSLR